MILSGYCSKTPVHWVSNGTRLPPLIRCPGSKFLHFHGDNVQVIENENIPYLPRCFTMPIRTYHSRSECFETTKENCTLLVVALKCYNPGECPKYHVRHSIFLNSYHERNGKRVTSQAICCW